MKFLWIHRTKFALALCGLSLLVSARLIQLQFENALPGAPFETASPRIDAATLPGEPTTPSLLDSLSGIPLAEVCQRIADLALGPNPPVWRNLRAENPDLSAEIETCLMREADLRLARNQFIKARVLFETLAQFELKAETLAKVHLGLAQTYFNLEDYAATRREAQLSKKFDVSLAEPSWLLAQVSYAEENLSDALELTESALAQSQNQTHLQKNLAAFHDKILEEIEIEENFRPTNSLHFRIKVDPALDPNLTRDVLPLMERAFETLVSVLENAPDRPINVIFYDPKSYQRLSKGHTWARAFYDGKIRIALKENFATEAFQKTLTHELTHAFLHQMTTQPLAPWFHEGLAQVVSNETPLRDGEKAGGLGQSDLDFGELEKDFFGLPAQEARVVYQKSYLLVQLLMTEKGAWGARQFIQLTNKGFGSQMALQKILATDRRGLDRLWAKTLERPPSQAPAL